MMLVSSAMDENKQERKWLIIKHSALRWAKTNNASSKISPWQIPIAYGMIVTSSSWLWWL
jgi:hypothetical protein